ncbi:MAG: hypothetical protein SFU99_07005 [Saprospiraceae bacterium]|nr:hypothetical protein [Saprospiraceae bacterium]
MEMLQVVTGIVFLMLLLSLLATTIMELVASVFSLRGSNLEKALRNLLASTDIDERILKAFKENALYKQLSFRYGSKREAPSYLTDESFQSILFDVILKGESIEKLQEKLDELPDIDLKNVLKQLLNDADNHLDGFKAKVKDWYNNVMDRASGWYKRSTQKILIVVGMLIAVVFNADTIAIYGRLEKDPEALQAILTAADAYVTDNDSIMLRQSNPAFMQSYDELKTFVNEELDAVKTPLGLGWYNVDISEFQWYDWLTKVLGWIVTALAISLGAPFWFDLLRKLVNIRNAGKKPGE